MKTLKLLDVLKMTVIAAFASSVIACGDGAAEDCGAVDGEEGGRH